MAPFERIPTSLGARKFGRSSVAEHIDDGMHGAPAEPALGKAEKVESQPPLKEPSKLAGLIRDRLSPEGLGEIKAMMFDPKLALTVAQREIVAKIGRYGELGDKTGIRRSVMELAEKLDVSSPTDGTVLVQHIVGKEASLSASQALGIQSGKRSLEMTQGGRALERLAPVLRENGAFDWKDGMDRGWRRLNERFAHQARGAVDVVVSPAVGGSSSADIPASGQAGVGRWSTSDSAASGFPVGVWNPTPGPAGSTTAQEGPVGSWVSPGEGAPPGGESSETPVGQWKLPQNDVAGVRPDAGAVGTWNVPDVSTTKGIAENPVGSWAAPGDAQKAGSQPVGQWLAPGGESGGASHAGPGSVGIWTAPDGPHDQAAVGQWTPSAGRGGEGPAGQWAKTGGSLDGSVGQWIAPGVTPTDTPGSATPEAVSSGPGSHPKTGAWALANDPPITGEMKLSDLVRSNPNISAVRFVELVSQPGQPAKFREVLSLGTSLLQAHFGR